MCHSWKMIRQPVTDLPRIAWQPLISSKPSFTGLSLSRFCPFFSSFRNGSMTFLSLPSFSSLTSAIFTGTFRSSERFGSFSLSCQATSTWIAALTLSCLHIKRRQCFVHMANQVFLCNRSSFVPSHAPVLHVIVTWMHDPFKQHLEWPAQPFTPYGITTVNAWKLKFKSVPYLWNSWPCHTHGTDRESLSVPAFLHCGRREGKRTYLGNVRWTM